MEVVAPRHDSKLATILQHWPLLNLYQEFEGAKRLCDKKHSYDKGASTAVIQEVDSEGKIQLSRRHCIYVRKTVLDVVYLVEGETDADAEIEGQFKLQMSTGATKLPSQSTFWELFSCGSFERKVIG